MKLQIRILAVLVVFVLSVGFGVWWFQQYKQKSRATAAPPRLFFTVPGAKVEAGSNFDLYVNINPNSSPFYSFDLKFTYDPTKVNFVDEANPLSNVTMLDSAVVSEPAVDVLTHVVTIKGTRTVTPFAGGEPVAIAKIAFVMKPETALPLQFNWDSTTNIAGQSAISKENLAYTGITPTVPVPSGATPVTVPTVAGGNGTPVPTIGASPAPQITGNQDQIGTTTEILPRGDRLYINSIIANPAPFRYEQNLVLDKGTYNLIVGAKVYYNKGRGMVIALHCNESDCGGGKKRNDIIVRTPVFPVKANFSEMQTTVVIPQEGDKKNYTMRIYCEDGTECEIDYITLEDAWGSDRIVNSQFADSQSYTDPRKQPTSWIVDGTANLFGTVDPAAGVHGALIINNPTK